MTTRDDQTDAIIDLTEIVEEGISIEQDFGDFAMNKAVDAKSLDDELDDLLREVDTPKDAHDGKDEIDFDALFSEAQNKSVLPSGGAADDAQAVDLSDLDDLFDSLDIGTGEEDPNALDLMLGQDRPQPAAPAPGSVQSDMDIDLDLEVPGIDAESASQDLLELTEEMLAEIPETVLVPPAAEAPRAPVEAQPEPLEVRQEAVETPQVVAEAPSEPTAATPFFPEDIAPAAKTAPAEPAFPAAEAEPVAALRPESTAPAECDVSHAELEILSARIDALEARTSTVPDITTDRILDLLPGTPGDIPAAKVLRDEMLERLESLAPASELEDARQSLSALQTALEALTRDAAQDFAPRTDMDELRQAMTAMQSRLDAMPDIEAALAQTAPATALQDMQAAVEELKAQDDAQDFAPRTDMDELRQAMTAMQTRLDAMPDIEAALAAPAAALQDMQAAVEELKARDAAQDFAPRSDTDELRQAMTAMQTRLDAMPDIEAALAAPAAALQDMQAAVEELKTRDAAQDFAPRTDMDELRQAMTAMQTRLDAMPDIQSALDSAQTASAALQAQEAELAALREAAQSQARGLDELRSALGEKDTLIAALRDNEARMRGELESLQARLNDSAANDSAASERLKGELQELIRQQVPLAAARIIREEIQTLLREIGG